MKIKLFSILLLLSAYCLLFPQTKAYAITRTDKTVTAHAGDTSTEIQGLLDYNKYGNYNLIVKVPAGSYELHKELRIYSHTTLLADPGAKFMKEHQRGSIITNDLTGDKGGYTTSSDITINGGFWDSKNIQNLDKGTESFRFIHATNVTIKNATICNVPESSHLITFGGVKNGIVDNCTLYGYVGSILKEAIQIDVVHDNVILPSMQSDILVYDDLPCDGITITNCNIYNYPRAIGSHTSVKGVFHKNIKISGNNLHDIKEAGIKAYNYVNLEVSNNTIKNTGIGVLVYTSISNEGNHYLEPLSGIIKEPLPDNYNITIKDNTISSIHVVKSGTSTLWGDGIRTIGNIDRPLSGVLISNNTVSGTARYGMFLEYTPNGNISGNTVSNTSQNGIYLINGCDSSSITANTVTKAGIVSTNTGGIGLSASKKVTISGNTVTSPGKNGIFLYSKSTSCSIANNKISSPGENGIALYQQSNGAIITTNKITNYKLRGIYAYQIGSGTINSNQIYGLLGNKSEDGIRISGDLSSTSTFTLKKNYIKNSNRYGMYISNAPKSYTGGNTIITAVKQAIRLNEGSNNSKVYYNVITNSDTSLSLAKSIGIANSINVELYKNKLSN
jgi:parallel beta-helix repeat protein